MSRLGPALLVLSMSWLSACGGGGVAPDGGSLDSGSNPQSGACQEAATQLCNCPSGLAGAQSCAAGAWAQCVCNSVAKPQVEAGMPASAERRCKAGYYTGTFEGEYWSGVFDLGFGSLFPVPVTAQATATNPGLGLTLEEKTTTIGEEFATYSVQDGCIIGNADAFGLPNPFVGVLSGELDCTTGKFEGTLKGKYDLLTTGITYPFEGPISAQYVDMELRDGMWDVKEHMMADNAPGGAGSWNVKWVGHEEEAPELPPECLEILDGSGDMAADDGVVAPVDAGY